MKRAIAVLLLSAVIACDRAVSPGRGLTFTTPGRYGDFILPLRDLAIPDTVTPNETVDVRFSIDDGLNPCSYSTAVTTWQIGVTYVMPWGVEHPGTACREKTFPLRIGGAPYTPEDSVRGKTVYYHPMDPFYHRVIVCRPDGSFERRDVVVRVPAPMRAGRGADHSDSTRNKDEDVCLRFQRWVVSGAR